MESLSKGNFQSFCCSALDNPPPFFCHIESIVSRKIKDIVEWKLWFFLQCWSLMVLIIVVPISLLFLCCFIVTTNNSTDELVIINCQLEFIKWMDESSSLVGFECWYMFLKTLAIEKESLCKSVDWNTLLLYSRTWKSHIFIFLLMKLWCFGHGFCVVISVALTASDSTLGDILEHWVWKCPSLCYINVVMYIYSGKN